MTDGSERVGTVVEFPGALWTTFDRYARYSAIVRAIRANLGPEEMDVLDVGDSSGYLTAFDQQLHPVCVDLMLTPDPLPGITRILGDGAKLPLPDRSFRAVVTSDTLEHVPPDLRDDFVGELARVSSDLVVVAAPFDTPGVAGAEELLRRYVLLSTGEKQEQLEEHQEHGLPRVDGVTARLEEAGLRTVVVGNGNLGDWVGMMLLKHQLEARPALMPLEAGYDIFYNAALSSREKVAPFYRHVVVARRDEDPTPGTPDQAPGLEGDQSLLALMVAANVTEVVRQDVEPRLDDLRQQVLVLQEAVGGLPGRLGAMEQLLAELNRRSEETGSKVDRLVDVIRHPLRSAGDVLRRQRPDDR